MICRYKVKYLLLWIATVVRWQQEATCLRIIRPWMYCGWHSPGKSISMQKKPRHVVRDLWENALPSVASNASGLIVWYIYTYLYINFGASLCSCCAYAVTVWYTTCCTHPPSHPSTLTPSHTHTNTHKHTHTTHVLCFSRMGSRLRTRVFRWSDGGGMVGGGEEKEDSRHPAYTHTHTHTPVQYTYINDKKTPNQPFCRFEKWLEKNIFMI